MTTEIPLLPMPKGEAVGMYQAWSYDQMQAYARANVLHHTALLQAEIEALLDERDALRERVGQLEYSNAVNADAKAQAAKYAEEVDRLRERVKELEADAERYRWLRDKCDRWDGGLVVAEVTEFSLSSWSGDDLNGAIDEAMAKENSND